MSEFELYASLFFLAVVYVIVFLLITSFCRGGKDGYCFNINENYMCWKKLNWFGVVFFTILYWIAFLPLTVIALIYWIFTVGRNDNNTNSEEE